MTTGIVPQKRCSHCDQLFPATTEYFRKASKEKSGLTSRCKTCLHQGDAKYREENPDQVKIWYEQEKIRNPDYLKNLYLDNRDEIIARSAQWQKDHPEQLNATRRKHYADDPNEKIKRRKYTDEYQARCSAVGGKIPKALKLELYEEQEHRCAYCGITLYMSIKGDVNTDHIKPLIKGGTNDKDNLVVCCKTCNSSKGTKDFEEWVKVRGW
jgi:5-methylcytosine-specific restriction endonuclease McrA